VNPLQLLKIPKAAIESTESVEQISEASLEDLIRQGPATGALKL